MSDRNLLLQEDAFSHLGAPITLGDAYKDAARMRAFRKACTGTPNDAFCDHFMAELSKLVKDAEEPTEEQFNQALDATMKEFP